MMKEVRVVKLLEFNIPGILVGKEVIDKNSARVGVCMGILLDLKTKVFYLLVGGKDYMLKVPVDAIADINDKFIRIDINVAYEGTSSKDVDRIIKLLQLEVSLLSRIFSLSTNKKFGKISLSEPIDIARLFNLI